MRESETSVETTTVRVKLVAPNRHKERKLRETRRTYRRGLAAAFRQECTTQSAANDVVVQYDLSGYAKNALKRYVPQLLAAGAEEVSDDQPVRFTNEGVLLDHKPQNGIEWYVRIPHHDDYQLWLPAQPIPTQRATLEALYAGDAKLGESRLLEEAGTWWLHMTVHRERERIEATSKANTSTPIGVDLGEAALATVCHRDEHGTPTAPIIFSDEAAQVRKLRKTYFTASRRLKRRGSERIVETYGENIWARIDHIIHRVTRRVVEYAQQVETPVLVLENLQYIREEMDYGAFMNRRLHGWAFAKLHAQIQYKARQAGIPVETVDPRNTSTDCHACGEPGTRPHQATFRCRNDDCWVSEYQADVNAALNIADRYLAGESQPRTDADDEPKVAGDDSGEDGVSLTGPQDTPETADEHAPTAASCSGQSASGADAS